MVLAPDRWIWSRVTTVTVAGTSSRGASWSDRRVAVTVTCSSQPASGDHDGTQHSACSQEVNLRLDAVGGTDVLRRQHVPGGAFRCQLPVSHENQTGASAAGQGQVVRGDQQRGPALAA